MRIRGGAEHGTLVDPSRLTVGEYLSEQWLAALAGRNLRPTTLDGYRQVVRTYLVPYLGMVRLQALDVATVERVLNDLSVGRSPKTVRSIPKEISATSAERLLATVDPVSPVERARHGLALEHLEDLRRLDDQMRASKPGSPQRSTESGTTLTKLFGVGPVVAAMVIGYTNDVTRFRNRDQFAAYTGTAPIEVSSGGRITHRLSRRGNRQLNHAIHIAAITQIRHAHSPGRVFFYRKVAEGKTKREAAASGRRRISDAIYRQLLLDAVTVGPEGQTGTALHSSVTGLTPQRPALRINHSRARTNATIPTDNGEEATLPRDPGHEHGALDNKEEIVRATREPEEEAIEALVRTRWETRPIVVRLSKWPRGRYAPSERRTRWALAVGEGAWRWVATARTRKIMALLAGAAQHNDLAEWDEYGALFADDAVMHVFGRDDVGREAIVAFTGRRHLGKHMLSTPIIEIDGDAAKVTIDHSCSIGTPTSCSSASASTRTIL